MTTKTETRPELDQGSGTKARKQHITKRIGGPDSLEFSGTALCGAKVTELLFFHSGNICQECADAKKDARE